MLVDPIFLSSPMILGHSRARIAFRHHLRTTGMMGLNYVFRFAGLFEEAEDVPIKRMSKIMFLGVRPHP